LLFAFSFLWLRDAGVNEISAASGAGLFIFGAFVTFHMGYLSTVASFIWVPFLLHAAGKRRWFWLAWGGGLQLLAGHPQYFYMGLVGLGIYLGCRRVARADWIWAVGAVSGSFLLAAFQLFPFWELIRSSVRSFSLDFSTATVYSQSLFQVVKMIFVPQWIHWLPKMNGDPYIMVFYVGPVALFLSLWAVLRIRNRRIAVGVAFLFVGIVLGLGRHTPLYEILFNVFPGFKFFRFPARWMALALMGFAFLAAMGMSRLSGRWSWILGIVLVLDLFAFSRASLYIFVDPGFFEFSGALIEDIRKTDGRVLQLPKVQSWQFYDWTESAEARGDLKNWFAAREGMLVSQTIPFHIREANSVGNHTPGAVKILYDRAAEEGEEGEKAKNRMGITHVIDVDETGLPKIVRFDWTRRTETFSRFQLDSGDLAPIRVDKETPNALALSIKKNTDLKSSFVMADTYFPGWRIFGKGKARDVERTQDGLRRISFRSGEDHLFLRYDPPIFLVGLVVSFIAGGALCLGFWRFRSIGKGGSPFFFALIFGVLGAVFVLKAFYDFFWGQPYANHFSPEPWGFVTVRNFMHFATAELLAGFLNVGAGWVCFRSGRRGDS